jgi:hypothetical protein
MNLYPLPFANFENGNMKDGKGVVHHEFVIQSMDSFIYLNYVFITGTEALVCQGVSFYMPMPEKSVVCELPSINSTQVDKQVLSHWERDWDCREDGQTTPR